MPLYEYHCEACGRRFEVIRKFSDPELDACTLCGKGPVQRQVSSPAIQFKGTGWYITDYSRKGKSGGDTTTTSADSKATAPVAEAAPGKPDSAPSKTESSAPATKPTATEN